MDKKIIWAIRLVRYGEEGHYLREGWEPFSAVSEVSSYMDNQNTQQIKSSLYVLLRRPTTPELIQERPNETQINKTGK